MVVSDLTKFQIVGGNNYSTKEQVIGQWLDGKPIYQKTINTGALPNKTTKTVAHNISNIDIVIEIRGIGIRSTTTTGTTANFLPLPHADGDASGGTSSPVCNIGLTANKTNIVIRGATQQIKWFERKV